MVVERYFSRHGFRTLNAEQEKFGNIQMGEKRKRDTYCGSFYCAGNSLSRYGKLVYSGDRHLLKCPNCGNDILFHE